MVKILIGYAVENHILKILNNGLNRVVGSTEAPLKAFLVFFLFSDWLKSNHLRSRIECGFLDIFRAIFVAL